MPTKDAQPPTTGNMCAKFDQNLIRSFGLVWTPIFVLNFLCMLPNGYAPGEANLECTTTPPPIKNIYAKFEQNPTSGYGVVRTRFW